MPGKHLNLFYGKYPAYRYRTFAYEKSIRYGSQTDNATILLQTNSAINRAFERRNIVIKTVWNIQYLTPPQVLKYCKKCGKKTQFYSSGQFRINAQRKCLDIWLIYKCGCCETTWNAAISSRVTAQSMPLELLERFTCNDQQLAEKYAMDIDFLRNNLSLIHI